MADEKPTADEDGGSSNTGTANVTSSLTLQPLEPKEENPAKLIPAAEPTIRTVTPPASTPATTSPAPATASQTAAEHKEHGKAGHENESTVTGGT